MKAYITFLSTDNYIDGVLVLKHSLNKVNSKYPLYCMITPNISLEVIEKLKLYNIEPITIDKLNIKDGIANSVKEDKFLHWNNCWDKLNIFKLIQFEKMVFLDADMLVLQNIDKLFDKPNMSAATDGIYVYGEHREKDLNAGLMVIEPNIKTFNDILTFINTLPEGIYQDQIVLQKYFSNWGNNKELHLSEEYNLWVGYLEYYPQNVYNNCKVLHYIGKYKPYMKRIPGKLNEMYLKYLNEISKEKLLSILVPQYNEDNSLIKRLLDSIQMQQNIDFSKIEVIICNDGGKVKLNEYFLKSYTFKVSYIDRSENKGVSFTRNQLLDLATGKYVMWCDADDMFMNANGLWLIFREFDDHPDVLVSAFYQEVFDEETGIITYDIKGDDKPDGTYVHGKVFEREFLLKQNIRWNNKLTIHEDSFFVCLASRCSKNFKFLQVPFYLWKYRENSICRRDKKYLLKTYNNMIDSICALCDELLKRNKEHDAELYFTNLVFSVYQLINRPEWQLKENAEYKNNVEKHFKDIFKKYKYLYINTSYDDKEDMYRAIKIKELNDGNLLESITFKDWQSYINQL